MHIRNTNHYISLNYFRNDVDEQSTFESDLAAMEEEFSHEYNSEESQVFGDVRI